MKFLKNIFCDKYVGPNDEIIYGRVAGELRTSIAMWFKFKVRFPLGLWVIGDSSSWAEHCWHCGMMNYVHNEEKNKDLRMEFGRADKYT